MGKQHGTLAKAGKVRKQTPKVEKLVKKRRLTGRALKRAHFTKSFAQVVPGQKKRGPNFNPVKTDAVKK